VVSPPAPVSGLRSSVSSDRIPSDTAIGASLLLHFGDDATTLDST
jgi:hypothetical protein